MTEAESLAETLADFRMSRQILMERFAEALPDMQRGIRRHIGRLWSGQEDLTWFLHAMEGTISRQLELAWHEGAAEMGMLPEELTSLEKRALALAINEQVAHITDFGMYIVQHSRANGGRLAPLLARGDMWINAYGKAKAQAMLLVRTNPKMMWVLGRTKKPCRDCLNYAGRIYRKNIWAKYDIRPKHPSLACGGWRCDCRFEPVGVEAPANRGTPPRMTG